MQSQVWNVMSLSGVAGFFWGSVLYELLKRNWGRAGIAIFCACAISIAACLAAQRL
jgi:hypothetical protein